MKTITKLTIIGLLVLSFSLQCFAVPLKHSKSVLIDTALSSEIKSQILAHRLDLYYPNSVKRFYEQNNFQSYWLKPQSETGPTWQAMLAIDCVLQFGLSPGDYHPNEFTYSDLNDILNKPGTVPTEKQAHFDIMLTDALINFINNLHFGKLNPLYTAHKIDNSLSGFRAEKALGSIFSKKNLMVALTDVQPRSKAYSAMQNQMRLWTGLYTGDCYEVPESDIRRLAVNMERLRWADLDTGICIQINIPSYTLKLHTPDSTYQFKVAVGNPEDPTPTLESRVNYFSINPKVAVANQIFENPLFSGTIKNQAYNGDDDLGKVAFQFHNIYGISLSGTYQKQLFKKHIRDFTNGNIKVQDAEKLARLLLKYSNTENKALELPKYVANHKEGYFTLQKSIPIKITYITNEVSKGVLLTYRDIYNLDTNLETMFYNQHFKTK